MMTHKSEWNTSVTALNSFKWSYNSCNEGDKYHCHLKS